MKLEIILADNSHLGQAGERVTLELSQADVAVPAEIPSYLAGYKNATYRADEASKVILVDNNEDKYRTFSSDDAFEPVRVKGSLSGPTPEIDTRSSLDSYKLVERFIGSFVNDITAGQVRNNGYDPALAAGRRCMNALNMDRELDVFGPNGLLTTITNWASANRLALGADQNWNGGSQSDPIKDIQTAVEASAQPVNGVWLNLKVANTFLRHDKVRDHMRQLLGDAPVANISTALATSATTFNPVDFVIPGLPPFHVNASKYKNSSGNLVYIQPDYAVLTTTPAGQPTDGEEIASTYSFRRRGPSGVGIETREYRVENRGPQGGRMLVAAVADVAKMTGNNCGGIISGIIV